MMNRVLMVLTICFVGAASSLAHYAIPPTQLTIQQTEDDPVLFTVGDIEVHVSEFKYIYTKTNGNKADFSEASLREYLDLYINFKLQVAEGVKMGLNENQDVKREQAQYKKELSNTYLTDREIVEKLVKEAYERSKKDRRLSHIMIPLKQGAGEKEEREIFKIMESIKAETTPDNFAEMAKKHSKDTHSKQNGGDLGFYTVLQLPYVMENALYETAVGEVSTIFRTPYGYHILKVTEERDAYGQLQVAHILRRTKPNEDAYNKAAKTKIDSLYNVLKDNGSFDELAAQFSQDNASRNKGGKLGWIGINQYDKAFEDAVFALSTNGSFGAPFQTSSGWHIVKRMNAIKTPAYQEVKGELTKKVKKDGRYKIVEDALIERIKKDGNFKLDEAIKRTLLDELTTANTYLGYRWVPSKEELNDKRVLFTVGTVSATVGEFMSFSQRNPADRYAQKPVTIEAAIDRILTKMVAQKCLAYEETQLDKKYPEFKALMREYEEGILLFEVKKQLVWDKASTDEEGLKKFYEENKDNYKWKARAKVTYYTLRTNDKKQVKKIRSKAKKKSPKEVQSLFNTDGSIVQVKMNTFEKGKNEDVDKMTWKAGSMNEGYEKDGSTYFIKIEEVVAPTPKSLDEARGYVVADYQDILEKNLIKELKENFKVEVDEEVLKSLIVK